MYAEAIPLRKIAPSRSTRWGDSRLWLMAGLGLAIVVALPLLAIVLSWLSPQTDVWQHLSETLLGDLVTNTVMLMLGVGLGTALLGVGLAWLVCMCDFPGRRLFEIMLPLPIVMPVYVLAFIFLGIFDYAGPLQEAVRAVWGADVVLPEIRSGWGLVLVMVLSSYPYVYLAARSAFLSQGRSCWDAARLLGLSPGQTFWRVSLPMARPAIAAGVFLALMEALADFGAVSLFSFDTFTTAIYKAWFGFFNMAAAAQLASVLLVVVLLLLVMERFGRGEAKFHVGMRHLPWRRFTLSAKRGWVASVLLGALLLVAFVLPMVQLVMWACEVGLDSIDGEYVMLLWHTLLLGGSGAVVLLICALVLSYVRRLGSRLAGPLVALASLGYALPGAVLAVGVMLVLSWADEWLLAPWGVPFLVAGSVVSLLFAYLVRFLAVAFNNVDSAMERIRPSLIEAARNLGAGHRETIRRVYLPILRPGLVAALLLGGVDIIKEMPATLLLRPFDWDTLAVRIFELTSEGQWQQAAWPSLTLVVLGFIPAALLLRHTVDRN